MDGPFGSCDEQNKAGGWFLGATTSNLEYVLADQVSKQTMFLSIEQGKEGEEKTPRGGGKAMRMGNRTALGAQLCHSVVGGLRAWHITSLSLGFLTSFRQQ